MARYERQVKVCRVVKHVDHRTNFGIQAVTAAPNGLLVQALFCISAVMVGLNASHAPRSLVLKLEGVQIKGTP